MTLSTVPLDTLYLFEMGLSEMQMQMFGRENGLSGVDAAGELAWVRTLFPHFDFRNTTATLNSTLVYTKAPGIPVQLSVLVRAWKLRPGIGYQVSSG